MKFFLTLLLISTIIIGCSTAKVDFEYAIKQDTINDYLHFQRIHSNSEFSKQVNTRLEELKKNKEEADAQADKLEDKKTVEILRTYKTHVTRYTDFQIDFYGKIASSIDDLLNIGRPYAVGFNLSSVPGLLRFMKIGQYDSTGSSISEIVNKFTGKYIFGRYIVNGRPIRFSHWDVSRDKSLFVPAVHLEFSNGLLTSIKVVEEQLFLFQD